MTRKIIYCKNHPDKEAICIGVQRSKPVGSCEECCDEHDEYCLVIVEDLKIRGEGV